MRVKDSNDHVLGETRSSFYLNLVLKQWMSASDGQTIHIPRDLFIWNEAVGRLLEDHVKYTAAHLKNSRFVKTLQIHESITLDGMISEMKKWSTASSGTNKEAPTKEFTTSLAHMREVYSFLYDKMVQNEEQRKKVCDAFLKNALVFVPFRSASTSCIKPQPKHQLSGLFHVLKDVYWRDPTEVALKLLRDHGKVTTRHVLEGVYHSLLKASSQQSLATFFVDQLKVDETPNVDEYLEMASAVAELAGFPTPSSVNDMLKVFAILGRKCIARDHKDSIRIENTVDVNMASFIRQSLDASFKCIFPSSGKWVSLSDKPLLLDNKSLFKIFQKEKGVHFIDLDDLFQDLKNRSTSENRKFVNEKEEMKHNVSLFLKACDIQRLSECVKRDFTPTLVKFQCVPLQKYFHQMIPAVQRFLYFKKRPVYEELKNEKFAEKLQQMQFASVEKLETVYSLSTHPDIHIVIEEKSGVEPVGSSFCFYVAEEHQENYDVLNGEMVKLLRVKRQDSSDLSNFLVAVKNYSGSDFQFFLEEVQGLEPLPDEEEPWCVPPPEVPEEVVHEASKDVVPSPKANISLPNRVGDDGLHSWPPKSSAQFDKTLKREAELSSDNTLKMWPPPAPPDSVKKSLEEKVQIQGRPTQRLVETEGPNDPKDTKEPDDRTLVMPRRNSKTLIMETANREEKYQTSSPNDPNPVKVDDVTLERVADDSLCDEETESVQDVLQPLGAQSPQKPERICTLPVPTCDVRRTSPPRTYLSFNEEASEIDYDDLSFNDGDLKILNGIQLGENPNSEEVGRWGERCVYEFLINQVKVHPTGENVDIIWLNEEANTTAPYDFEIRRPNTGVNQEAQSKTVITYIEVKTTSSDQKEVFEISVPELLFALEKKEAFHLYRVFNAGKRGCLRIRRLKNLASQLEKRNVKLFMAI